MFNSTAESRYVKFDNLEIIDVDGHKLLRATGLVMHSSMVVSSIEQKQMPGAVQVIVHIALTRAGMTGSFEFYVPITPDLQTVTFGMQNNALWHRQAMVLEAVA